MTKQVEPVDRWPSGEGRTVAVLGRAPERLSADYQLEFASGVDGLDAYVLAAIEDAGVGQFWLFRHVRSPLAGTEIVIDSSLPASAGLAAVRRQLGVQTADFSWTSPDELDPRFVATAGPIAIDGPAASGKSAVGEAMAGALGFGFLDTGLMYRAFTLAAIRAGVGAADAEACGEFADRLPLAVATDPRGRIEIGEEDVTAHLRDPEVEANVSAYSAIPAVRTAMVARQRELAAAGSVILAGRDIGTVVLPDAPLKLYLTASEEARARRRGEQSGGGGASARRDIAGRDHIDSTRTVSPLKPAEDAIVIDTTDLTLPEVIDLALGYARCRRS